VTLQTALLAVMAIGATMFVVGAVAKWLDNGGQE
jgi:hypothetical protein